MDKCETREDFTLLLQKQFEFVSKSAAKSVAATTTRFWGDTELLKRLQSEQMALPEWGIFVRILEKTPDGASKAIAALIAVDNEGGEIDWQAQWKECFLTTFNPWKRREWKYFGYVSVQAKGFIAAAKIGFYADLYADAIKRKR